MDSIEIEKLLVEFLSKHDIKIFTKLISRSIDNAGPKNGMCINDNRVKFVEQFVILNKFNLTEQNKKNES